MTQTKILTRSIIPPIIFINKIEKTHDGSPNRTAQAVKLRRRMCLRSRFHWKMGECDGGPTAADREERSQVKSSEAASTGKGWRERAARRISPFSTRSPPSTMADGILLRRLEQHEAAEEEAEKGGWRRHLRSTRGKGRSAMASMLEGRKKRRRCRSEACAGEVSNHKRGTIIHKRS